MRIRHYAIVLLTPFFCCCAIHAETKPLAEPLQYALEYRFKPRPEEKSIDVTLLVEHAELVRKLDFNLKNSRCYDFRSQAGLTRVGDRLAWLPEGSTAVLKYRCSVNSERESYAGSKAYDAIITSNYTLFRGDDMVPSVRSFTRKGAKSSATLVFDLPEGWSVNTGWTRTKPTDKGGKAPTFKIENGERNFDRPTGWMLAGKIATRRESILLSGDRRSRVAVSAPEGSGMRRMDILVYAQILWPKMEAAFGRMPEKVLIVGGDDPLWRGGLSAPNSFYMHAARPIVSENGTSALAHEFVHMVTRIRGKKNFDWIAEGIAEFYSVELLYRAGGISSNRRERILEAQKKRAAHIRTLSAHESSGANTAAAYVLFYTLDAEVRAVSQGKYTLDDIVRELMVRRKVDTRDLVNAFTFITGGVSKVLQSERVRGAE